jgi:hypothetical protein
LDAGNRNIAVCEFTRSVVNNGFHNEFNKRAGFG